MSMILILLFLLLMVAALVGGGYFCILALHPEKKEVSGLESVRNMQKYFSRLDARHKVRNLLAVRVISQTGPGRRRERLDREVTDVLLNRFPDAMICQYDEDSWLILMEGGNCMRSLRERAVTLEDSLGGHPDFRRIYFGAYYRIASTISFEEAVLRAQRACSEAQIQLSSPICEWDYRMNQTAEKREYLEQKIHTQLEENRVFLEFQPMVDAAGRVVGGEALARLNSERDGVLAPGAFLPTVENVGISEEFDYYVFDKCCRWLSGLGSTDRDFQFLSFNFTVDTVYQEDFPERILEIADRYQIRRNRLAVECHQGQTGSELLHNLMQLKNAGLRIFLTEKTPEVPQWNCGSAVKITADQLGEQARQLAEELKKDGTELICSNVETPGQAAQARQIGCSVLQGYYFYRPMSVSGFEKLITDNL